jgi:hypothetical protein
MNEPEDRSGTGIKPGITNGGLEAGTATKAPRWTIAFLRALARTGDVRAAAEDAGIDHSTAYARRRAYPEFAGLWRGALVAHETFVKGKEAEEIAALQDGPSIMASSGNGSPLRSGEELVGGADQLKRAGHDRWSQAKEKLFFDELAATANVKRAARAAGVSTNAVYARRMKTPVFRAKWDAVLETGRAAIEMKLVEAANRSFDPDEIDLRDAEPKVSVAEAIRIVQLHGSKGQREAVGKSLREQAEAMSPDEVEEVRERILGKLRRWAERDEREKLSEGWTRDERYDQLVPPGWVRA